MEGLKLARPCPSLAVPCNDLTKASQHRCPFGADPSPRVPLHWAEQIPVGVAERFLPVDLLQLPGCQGVLDGGYVAWMAGNQRIVHQQINGDGASHINTLNGDICRSALSADGNFNAA